MGGHEWQQARLPALRPTTPAGSAQEPHAIITRLCYKTRVETETLSPAAAVADTSSPAIKLQRYDVSTRRPDAR